MIRVTFERSPKEDALSLDRAVSRLTGLTTDEFSFEVIKKSLDARRHNIKYIYTVDISVKSDENAIAKKIGGEVIIPEAPYEFPKCNFTPKHRPIVIGFGPAGIFASLMLARAGLKPIVIERGKDVDSRKVDVDSFFAGEELNEESNIQYGEGGAGAFSDGKLNTLVKDKSFRGSYILKALVNAGAPEEILYLAKPHIGTDLLINVVKRLREEIIRLGGEIHFETKLESVKAVDGKIASITASGREYITDTVFLATGQSAREIAEMLCGIGAKLERKPFSVGFRIEHLQKDIDLARYGENDFLPFLPPSEYKLFKHCNNGRTVYSFCMCPGGVVVAAASERERLLTNGMSYHSRSGLNANSAILCEVTDSDIGDSLFAGYDFREALERKAYSLGGSDFKAPAMYLGDYLESDKKPRDIIKPTYPRGVKFTDISEIFPEEMNESFREAFEYFGRKIKGFDSENAVITAVESRTSSPIRILRFDDRQSNIKGLYPLGEGAGYAGGIISAAIDGLRSVEEYILSNNE